jgi:asparagine synthase (glutamine-hydrolysing)
MCGISLVIDPVGGRTDVSIVERMTAAIKHRGPDGASFESLNNCYMGHARLSIIDLDTGTQPMADSSNRYWIVFNGEIYNYRELRAELLKLGAKFDTNSDTEVVIQSFIVWGDLCVDHLRGMFAFAIWDTATNQLFAARDLFGEKPLYYAVTDDGRFLISSEIKGLLASGLIRPVINAESIDSYLTFGYVAPDRTVYSGIETLPAGCWLRWDKNITAITRYWAPKFEERPISVEDATSEFYFLLQRAVKRQMVSDVPIGAFLSGGLDSSTIVALMQQQYFGKIKTFSAGFGDHINELPYARAVARKFNTDHYELDFGSPDVAELLVQMSQIYDEPFADTSNIPTFLISKFAREHVKVVMGGDGGDETLGGYWWYPPPSRI